MAKPLVRLLPVIGVEIEANEGASAFVVIGRPEQLDTTAALLGLPDRPTENHLRLDQAPALAR